MRSSAGEELLLVISYVAGRGGLTAVAGSWDSSLRYSRESGRLSSNHSWDPALRCTSCDSIRAMKYRVEVASRVHEASAEAAPEAA